MKIVYVFLGHRPLLTYQKCALIGHMGTFNMKAKSKRLGFFLLKEHVDVVTEVV